MLKWIQESDQADVVALTSTSGSPARTTTSSRERRRSSARWKATWWRRKELAEDYVAPAIKANALYGGGYPLFTALGRPLIAKLAGQ